MISIQDGSVFIQRNGETKLFYGDEAIARAREWLDYQDMLAVAASHQQANPPVAAEPLDRRGLHSMSLPSA